MGATFAFHLRASRYSGQVGANLRVLGNSLAGLTTVARSQVRRAKVGLPTVARSQVRASDSLACQTSLTGQALACHPKLQQASRQPSYALRATVGILRASSLSEGWRRG